MASAVTDELRHCLVRRGRWFTGTSGSHARATTLSVRALRYYDHIGLLTPSRRTPAGHRVYDDADVRRLYRICLLRRIGLGLTDIGRALDEPSWQLRHALSAHMEMLDHQLAAGAAARRRVAAMVAAIEAEHTHPPRISWR